MATAKKSASTAAKKNPANYSRRGQRGYGTVSTGPEGYTRTSLKAYEMGEKGMGYGRPAPKKVTKTTATRVKSSGSTTATRAKSVGKTTATRTKSWGK